LGAIRPQPMIPKRIRLVFAITSYSVSSLLLLFTFEYI
jgi:hypothetical protein